MKTIILKVGGMTCSACQNRVEKYLNKQDGVEAVVNLVMEQAIINYDAEKVSIKDLNRFIKESGYKPLGIFNEREESKKDNYKICLFIYGLLLVLIMYISMSHMFKLPIFSYLNMMTHSINNGICLFIISSLFLVFGFDILSSGIKKIIHKSPNMDTLVTIGVLSSFIYSTINLVFIILGNNSLIEHLYFESVAMIIYFVKIGRYIDRKSKNKTKEAIKDLVQITPQNTYIKTKEGVKQITIDEVKVGDILICFPGEKVAVDGTIIEGVTHIDESFITGESIPSKKKINDKVVAGSINIEGYIEYIAEGIGPDSTISEIVRLVSIASNTKAPIARIADIVSSYFVPGIVIISIFSLMINLIITKDFNYSFIKFVTVLVVSCPCALGLATPLAIVTSIGKCAKEGIIIKKSETLEIANKINTIVFDKTGTLTIGKLKVSEIFNYSDINENELLKIVSSIESNSSHPIASAFKEVKALYKVNNFNNIEGIGLEGIVNEKKYYLGNNKLIELLKIKNSYQKDEHILTSKGNSIIYVIRDKEVIALIGVKDIIREEAKKTIEILKDRNIEIILLSGDNEKTTNIIAKSLGISNVIANVKPKEKENVIKKIKETEKVVMIGDGINDAPSLATADIGISMSNATDIASNSSDVLLTHNKLDDIIKVIDISKKTIRIIKENLFWAFSYNIIMIPIAIGIFEGRGLSISPMIASISMTISSLTVVINSLRLK